MDGRNVKSRSLTGHGRFISGVVVGMLIAGAFAGGTALASIPTSGTKVINGCRNVKTGALRVIDVQARHKCVKGELPLNWNAQGVPGAPGKQGASAVKYWAAVGYDGTLIASSGGISVAHSSAGNYQITLPAGVNAAACASVASVSNTVDMVATPSGAAGNSIAVLVRSQEPYPNNGYYDANFSVAVLC